MMRARPARRAGAIPPGTAKSRTSKCPRRCGGKPVRSVRPTSSGIDHWPRIQFGIMVASQLISEPAASGDHRTGVRVREPSRSCSISQLIVNRQMRPLAGRCNTQLTKNPRRRFKRLRQQRPVALRVERSCPLPTGARDEVWQRASGSHRTGSGLGREGATETPTGHHRPICRNNSRLGFSLSLLRRRPAHPDQLVMDPPPHHVERFWRHVGWRARPANRLRRRPPPECSHAAANVPKIPKRSHPTGSPAEIAAGESPRRRPPTRRKKLTRQRLSTGTAPGPV